MLIGICMLAVCMSCSSTEKANGTDTMSYRTTTDETDSSLGRTQTRLYEGLLPDASCRDAECRLLISNREHSGDGTFKLTLVHKGADGGKDKTKVLTGRRYTLRGMPCDDNATVWQFIDSDSRQIFNFLYQDDKNLILLNDKFEKHVPYHSLKLTEYHEHGSL